MAERGRPKKAKSERRERQLHILLTDGEQKLIEAAAESASLDKSVWARSTILNAAKLRDKNPRQG